MAAYGIKNKRLSSKDDVDFFPTPPWATRALCEFLMKYNDLADMNVWEPACGQGHMAMALAEYFGTVRQTDIVQYGQNEILDFLATPRGQAAPGWVITNPPYNKAEEFIKMANSIAVHGVAMLVRTTFLASVRRYNTLFSKNPPHIVLQFTERVPMVKGRLDRKASTATDCCWLVWNLHLAVMWGKRVPGTALCWIPPCRKKLERDEDYA